MLTDGIFTLTPPAPYVSYRAKVASDATSFKILGGGFGSQVTPVVNLTLWTGPSGVSYEFVELSDFPEFALSCFVDVFDEEYIVCSGFSLSSLPSTISTGVIYGSIFALGRTAGPTVLGDIVPRSYQYFFLTYIP
jgi:hypothetical protein